MNVAASSNVVCRRSRNLWDIMNHFNAVRLFYLYNQLMTYECSCASKLIEGGGGMKLDPTFRQEVIDVIEEFRRSGKTNGLGFVSDLCTQARYQLSETVDVSATQVILNSLKYNFVKGLNGRNFITITEDRIDYLDGKSLFGDAVSEAFPSADKDIVEAGNCLAVECNTAAVFHLMRAAEFALRALAIDRNITFKDKPLDEKEWGQILSALEGKLGELRIQARSSWSDPKARDAQIRFYNEVIQELRSFNDAWRRHASHADSMAFYDRNSALGIFEHVRTFMQKLSGKISETSVTPEYWPVP